MTRYCIMWGIIIGVILGVSILVSFFYDKNEQKAIEEVLWQDKTGFKGSVIAHKIGDRRYIVGEWVVGRATEPLWLVEVGKVYNINGLTEGRTPYLPYADLNPVWAHEQWVKTRGRW